MPSTKDVVQGYFRAVKQKDGWESFLANDLAFTRFASPNKRLAGKAA